MRPTSSCGSRLSPRAIGHTGFTGTSLWIDPANDLYIALLTNRVHPTRENNQIQGFRRRLHDAIGDHWLTGAG
jgi:CubicO group peptidase (beta-lactamase class C family)